MGLLSGALGAVGGLAGGLLSANSIGGASFSPLNIQSGIGGVSTEDGVTTTTLDPRFQALSDQLTGVSGGLFGQLQGDPTIAASDLFTQALALAAPEQARARSSNEARLFAQGRLGSTGGLFQTQGLERGISDAKNQLALQSIFDAQSLQDQLLNRGLAAQQGSIQLEQLPLGLLNPSMQGGQSRLQGDMFSAQQTARRGDLRGGLLSSAFGGIGAGIR